MECIVTGKSEQPAGPEDGPEGPGANREETLTSCCIPPAASVQQDKTRRGARTGSLTPPRSPRPEKSALTHAGHTWPWAPSVTAKNLEMWSFQKKPTNEIITVKASLK